MEATPRFPAGTKVTHKLSSFTGITTGVEDVTTYGTRTEVRNSDGELLGWPFTDELEEATPKPQLCDHCGRTLDQCPTAGIIGCTDPIAHPRWAYEGPVEQVKAQRLTNTSAAAVASSANPVGG